MSDLKLFRIDTKQALELKSTSVALEKSLQSLIEKHAETLLGVRFLASEYKTGSSHGGRIDSLGIDENGTPVIVEYKRAVNESVINQGLFYLDWLLDHKAEFVLLVQKKLGQKVADTIDWSVPRVVCIAGDFTRYDEHSARQMKRGIELIRYRRYSPDLLLLELVFGATTATVPTQSVPIQSIDDGREIEGRLANASTPVQDLYHQLKDFLMGLGDDVSPKTLKHYFAFKRLKNFACVEVFPQKAEVVVYVKVDPSKIQLDEGFTRDVRKIGHFGTGDLEITLRTPNDLTKAQPHLIQSYEQS